MLFRSGGGRSDGGRGGGGGDGIAEVGEVSEMDEIMASISEIEREDAEIASEIEMQREIGGEALIVGFVGHPNVGKTSLLNALVTSPTPRSSPNSRCSPSPSSRSGLVQPLLISFPPRTLTLSMALLSQPYAYPYPCFQPYP